MNYYEGDNILEDEVKLKRSLIDFSILLLIIIGVIGMGFAYYFGMAPINLDPPLSEREETVVRISISCFFLSLYAIGIGLVLAFKRRVLLTGPLGFFFLFLGGIIVVEHFTRRYERYAKLGYTSHMDYGTALAEVIVWVIIMFVGIFLLVIFFLRSGTKFIWKKIQREPL